MRKPSLFWMGLLWAGASVPVAGTEAPKDPVAAVVAELDRMAGQPLWPGFDPKSVPLAFWDGGRTILYRHPSPPPEMKQEGERWAVRGRHPAMRANTSAQIGGALTATLLLDPRQPQEPARWAATLIHEAFHVFQRQHHPAWQGNEADLFLYPVDDPGALALRRLESEALRRALAAKDREGSACWAGKAVAYRNERFGKIRASAAAYERGTELNEGLASFVEARALGDTAGPAIPEDEYPAEDVRGRAYDTGQALAVLLERFDPVWKDALQSGKAASLDELLSASLAKAPGGSCELAGKEVEAVHEKAKADAGRIAQDHKARRDAFFARSGWTLEIVAGVQPLLPSGFDPLNVSSLGNGEVLHSRFLQHGEGESNVEVFDHESLTESIGAHPLLNGVRKVIVTGLAAEPKVREEEGFTILEAEGVSAALKGGKVVRAERTVRVVLPPV